MQELYPGNIKQDVPKKVHLTTPQAIMTVSSLDVIRHLYEERESAVFSSYTQCQLEHRSDRKLSSDND